VLLIGDFLPFMCKATEALSIVLSAATLYEHRWQKVCLRLALWRLPELRYFRETARDLDFVFSLSKVSKGVGNWFSLVDVIALDSISSARKLVSHLQFFGREKTECSCGTFSLA
jgi:hypothetical protein